MSNNLLTILFIVAALFATACTPAAPNNTATSTEAVETEAVAPDTSEADTSEEVAAEADTELATAEPAEEAADSETADTATETIATMEKLNLNTVTGDELLATIPDFGNRMVREFDEYRPYVSIQQFRREIGKYVDDAQVAFYEEYVYVPVNVNESDADTLMQIPGLDQATADTLMAARPFDSNDAFLQALADAAPNVDSTVAQAYLEAE